MDKLAKSTQQMRLDFFTSIEFAISIPCQLFGLQIEGEIHFMKTKMPCH
jgi:hypothetical protein